MATKNSTSIVSSVTMRDLRRFVKDSVNQMDRESIRNLVNTYYDIQGYRITLENRIRAAADAVKRAKEQEASFDNSIDESDDASFNLFMDEFESEEDSSDDNVQTITKGRGRPKKTKEQKETGIREYDFNTDTLTSYSDYILSLGMRELEEFIKNALKAYVDNDPIGQWCTSIMGIGPVIAAGLLSYIDISKCKTAGCIWSYAGITGKEVKKKGEKLNYSPKFKTLCWKIGQSFIKTSNNPKDIYGHLYKEKKQFYQDKNNSGGFAERAAEELETKKIAKGTQLYKTLSEGKLSDAHINAMASRFAVKIFLSHLFEVWYEYHNNEKPPKPFVEAHLNHVHIIGAPNRDMLFDQKKVVAVKKSRKKSGQ